MSWRREWSFISGYVLVTANAVADDDNGDEKDVSYKFLCFVGEGLSDYDKLDYIEDVALAMANLRGYYRYEIVDVQEVGVAMSSTLKELLETEVTQ